MKNWFRTHIQPTAIRGLATGLGIAMQAWMRTVDTRIADYGPNADASLKDFHGPAIYILWHEYILLPATSRRGSDLTLLVGLHRDADWFSEIAQSFGFKTVRGSSSRGGITAILRFTKAHKNTSMALTPDGPRGPRRVLSPGCIQLSALLQMPLIPVGIGFNAPFRGPTWDHFAVPRLSTRGRMILGPPVHVPRKLDEARLDAYHQHVDQVMKVLNTEAESWAMDGLPRCGERALFHTPHASNERMLIQYT